MKRVFIKPTLHDMRSEESGIKRVIEAYAEYLPQFGYEVVSDESEPFDVSASHAGTLVGADVAHVHGLYWSADYDVDKWEVAVNSHVIASIRYAKQVTVPSAWVAETFQRDMRFTPHIIHHGIKWENYTPSGDSDGYVLWNKNRDADVCSPYPVGWLSSRFPKVKFVSTFRPQGYHANNLTVTGVLPHDSMRAMLQKAGVYLATTKETFGIGILEALAFGVPVLGFACGGILEMIKHKQNGYLAEPNNFDDLAEGLNYCIANQKNMRKMARESVKRFGWPEQVEKVAHVYDLAAQPEPATVSVIIPTHNYGTEDKLGRAILSASKQTYPPDRIVVVDDGSDDGGATQRLVEAYQRQFDNITYIRHDNQGVAVTRNRGIASVNSKYICCLDADDAIEPQFLEACIAELEKDRSLGMAYTGLQWIKPDGSTGLSAWPGTFDFDRQLKRQNQVPTCCVFRRVMWERLGGYDQRYAPRGAGSEDAEFWLRAGAAGFGAKKVTDAGLFVYSWMSGHVTSDRNYREVDWTEMHPWTKDDQHPFASLAKPKNGFSHLVRQYDQPIVSVIIPVGKGHEREFLNALDSLDAQTLRQWEAIVVLSGAKFKQITQPQDDILPDSFEAIRRAYPYVRFVICDRNGAGAARNEGAKLARAKMLLFLDADDWLYPTALEKMVNMFVRTGDIIYTDYVGKAYISHDDALKLGDRLLSYDDQRGEAVIKHYSAEFDCERAQRQPDEVNKDTFIWCLITSLVEKRLHEEIGGFDEGMRSWEDWDYWIRLAQAGHCFTRIPEDLVVYRFYTGERRETGLRERHSLLEYMVDKKEKAKIMPCGCSGRKGTNPDPPPTMRVVSQRQMSRTENSMSDENLVLITYKSPNMGQHKVMGAVTKTFYGYRSGSEQFYVHQPDIDAQPWLFEPVPIEKPTPEPVKEKEPEALVDQEKELAREKGMFDLQSIPGVTDVIADALISMGAYNKRDVYEMGLDGLKKIKGIGMARATAIIAWLNEQEEQGLL